MTQNPQTVSQTSTAKQDDPWAVLQVRRNATDEQIRTAYLDQVRLHPPERDPDCFEQIRDAYDQLRDPMRRAKLVLQGDDASRGLQRLLEEAKPRRQFVGPEPWIAAMKERRS